MAGSSGPIQLSFVVGPEWRVPSVELLAFRLSQVVNEVIGALDLPRTRVETRIGGGAIQGNAVLVLVNGHPVYLPMDPELAGEASVSRLAERVRGSLLATPGRLLTPAAIRELWRKLWRRRRAVDPRFAALARELAERGLPVAATLAAIPPPERRAPERWPATLEWAIEERAAGEPPIVVSLSHSRAAALLEHEGTPTEEVVEAVGRLREWLYLQTGVLFPEIVFRREPGLASEAIRLRAGHLDLPARQRERLAPLDALLSEMESTLLRQAWRFVTPAQMEQALHRLDAHYPMLVLGTPARYPPVRLARLLRPLVREGGSIRDLRTILERLLQISGTVAERRGLVAPPAAGLIPGTSGSPADQEIRADLRKTLAATLFHSYADGGGGWRTWRPPGELVEPLRGISDSETWPNAVERLLASCPEEPVLLVVPAELLVSLQEVLRLAGPRSAVIDEEQAAELPLTRRVGIGS